MAHFAMALAIAGAAIGFWYWNYWRKVKAAGGADKLAEKRYCEEFGLADDERVAGWWMGVCYIGPLRPGSGAATFGDRFGNAVDMLNQRGAQAHLCVTNHGRVAISMEPRDGLGRDAAIAQAHFGSQKSFFRPFALVAPGAARLLVFEEAFPGAAYPAGDAPSMTSMAGGVARYQLVHYVGADGTGLSLWIDPAAVPALRSALAPRAPAAQALPVAS